MEGMEAIKDNAIIQALLWAVGVELAIISWFIIWAVSKQAKKDDEQDEEIDKWGKVMEKTNEVLSSMREMLARHDTNIEWLMKSIEKSTRK